MAYSLRSEREENARSSQAGRENLHEIFFQHVQSMGAADWMVSCCSFYFLIPHRQIIKPTGWGSSSLIQSPHWLFSLGKSSPLIFPLHTTRLSKPFQGSSSHRGPKPRSWVIHFTILYLPEFKLVALLNSATPFIKITHIPVFIPLKLLSGASCAKIHEVQFPNHYNRFQMVLEIIIDSEHQKKSVIL